jgi:DNA-binding MarR family transcriptional regulator
MKLEDEIHQHKGFQDQWEKLVLNIIFTGNWINTYQHHQLKQYDLTPEQYNILRILRGQHPEPASVNLLKARMLNKMSNASRLVEKLRQKGFTKREECQRDRRQVEVCITDKGLELLKTIENQELTPKQRFQHLSEEEASQVNDLLDRLREASKN